MAGRAIDGETEFGDAHLLVPSTGGFLAAVVDGLGHGPEAAAASRTAVAALCRDPDAPVEDLVHRCHKDLAKTRGAVISLVSFSVESGLMTWLAVGNVEGVLYRADPAMVPPKESLLPRGGVVGYQMPPLRPRGCGSPPVIRWFWQRTASRAGSVSAHRPALRRKWRPTRSLLDGSE